MYIFFKADTASNVVYDTACVAQLYLYVKQIKGVYVTLYLLLQMAYNICRIPTYFFNKHSYGWFVFTEVY